MSKVDENLLEEFAMWLNEPESERQPKTQKDWAFQHGVHETTITNWRRRLEARGDEGEIERFKNKVYQFAMKGNARYAELYAKLNKLFPDPREERSKEVPLTADDYRRIDEEADRRIRESENRSD